MPTGLPTMGDVGLTPYPRIYARSISPPQPHLAVPFLNTESYNLAFPFLNIGEFEHVP
jgi:hypothetical protein